MTEADAYLGFSLFQGVGPLIFKKLKAHFTTALSAWNASETEWLEAGLGQALTKKFIFFRPTFDTQKTRADLAKGEMKFITQIDPSFPSQLLEISDPPIGLFIKGTFPTEWEKAIGVVGTRKPTGYGREITQKLTQELVASGCLIISGMARGVDGIAHRTTLENNGNTVAVLGCGVDIIYPPDHKDLYFDIIKSGGAIISEVAPGHTVLKGLFPARNRIISGLSRGIVVTEGAEDSGSLITARLAAEQNRDVFAVPGPITSYLSVGPMKLLKDGAKVVTEAGDILEEYGWGGVPKQNGHITGLSPMQQKIVEELTTGAKQFDELVRSIGILASEASVLLTQLELSGIIGTSPDGLYQLR